MSLAAKDTLRTDLSISGEMVPSIVAEDGIALRVYCRLARGAPPIHFGREDGVERTLLRVACQSETFLAPPWQGGIDIRVLWHIGCQSDFDKELLNFRLVCILATSQETQFLTLSSHPVK